MLRTSSAASALRPLEEGLIVSVCGELTRSGPVGNRRRPRQWRSAVEEGVQAAYTSSRITFFVNLSRR